MQRAVRDVFGLPYGVCIIYAYYFHPEDAELNVFEATEAINHYLVYNAGTRVLFLYAEARHLHCDSFLSKIRTMRALLFAWRIHATLLSCLIGMLDPKNFLLEQAGLAGFLVELINGLQEVRNSQKTKKGGLQGTMEGLRTLCRVQTPRANLPYVACTPLSPALQKCLQPLQAILLSIGLTCRGIEEIHKVGELPFEGID
ncbi:MAG: hypothetical protein SGPRY_009879 [Prymnesium sp.]